MDLVRRTGAAHRIFWLGQTTIPTDGRRGATPPTPRLGHAPNRSGRARVGRVGARLVERVIMGRQSSLVKQRWHAVLGARAFVACRDDFRALGLHFKVVAQCGEVLKRGEFLKPKAHHSKANARCKPMNESSRGR